MVAVKRKRNNKNSNSSGKGKKKTAAVPPQISDPSVPKSFVLCSGKASRSVRKLVKDFRKVMEPNTASRLRERKNNKLKDFLSMAGPLGVSHIMIFHQTDNGCNLRMAKCPRGPTFTFRVENYTTSGDLQNVQQKLRSMGTEFLHSPLVVLNNFSCNSTDEEEVLKMKLTTSMFQNAFPSIKVKGMNLKDARRVALFNRNQETGLIEFRHYLITVKPVGVSKSIKKVISSNCTTKIPNLSTFEDIADYVKSEDYASEVSDNEDVIDLPQNYVGRVNRKSESRAIVLHEIGPRMDLRLIKIEEGFSEGRVLYHAFQETRSVAEIAALEKKIAKQKKEKAKRRKEQEKNVARKKKTEEKTKQEGGEEGDDDFEEEEGFNYEDDDDYLEEDLFEDDDLEEDEDENEEDEDENEEDEDENEEDEDENEEDEDENEIN